MAKPFRRQDDSRFDEIEAGDSVTYFTPTLLREEEEFVRFDPAPSGPPYGERIKKQVVLERPGGYYPTGKIVGGSSANGWLLKKSGSKKTDPAVVVTRENFRALRKAAGKGNSGANRFEKDDAVVSCQVCDGMWIGNSGRTPHHGYHRPGWGQRGHGEQTPSCVGALELPYAVLDVGYGPDPKGRVLEVGRYVLPGVILSFKGRIADRQAYLAKVAAGTISLPSRRAYEDVTVDFPISDPRRFVVPGVADYSFRQREVLRDTQYDIEAMERTVSGLQARYDSWLPGGEGVERAPVRLAVGRAPGA